MKKKAIDTCKGCIWANRISEQRIFCPFPQCVRGKLPPGGSGRKTEKERLKHGG